MNVQMNNFSIHLISYTTTTLTLSILSTRIYHIVPNLGLPYFIIKISSYCRSCWSTEISHLKYMLKSKINTKQFLVWKFFYSLKGLDKCFKLRKKFFLVMLLFWKMHRPRKSKLETIRYIKFCEHNFKVLALTVWFTEQFISHLLCVMRALLQM